MGESSKEAGLPFRMLDRQDIRAESPFFADDLLGVRMRNRFDCKSISSCFFTSCRIEEIWYEGF